MVSIFDTNGPVLPSGWRGTWFGVKAGITLALINRRKEKAMASRFANRTESGEALAPS